jgi:glucose-1-phosphate adenylyltransferase
MANCRIGRHSRIRRAIIPAGVVIPEFSVIGHDLERDQAQGFTVTESGVVVVPPAGADVVRAVQAISA